MTFTKTPPTRPGAYLYRRGDDIAAAFVYPTDGDRLIAELSDAYCGSVSQMEGEWCALVSAEELENAWQDGYTACATGTDRMTEWSNSRARKIAEGEAP